jgi:hypothetical protein
MAYKSLDSTFVFNNLNHDGKVSKNILAVLKDGERLTKDDLAEQFLVINKNFKYPLKFKILDEVERGDIVMIYSPANIRLPIAIPFFLTKLEGKVVGVVVVDLFGTRQTKTNSINIEAKKLYTLLEAAYFAKLCFYNDKQISTRNTVISNGSVIYANMIVRVFNRKYALNIDKNKMNRMLYFASKFYLINLLGLKNDEMTNNYALKSCKEANLLSISEMDSIFKDEGYENIANFIQEVNKKELSFNFKDLQVRGFLESYLQMYESTALLALESFPYFLFNILAVTNGAYMNNQYVLEDLVGTNGAKIYADLLHIE